LGADYRIQGAYVVIGCGDENVGVVIDLNLIQRSDQVLVEIEPSSHREALRTAEITPCFHHFHRETQGCGRSGHSEVHMTTADKQHSRRCGGDVNPDSHSASAFHTRCGFSGWSQSAIHGSGPAFGQRLSGLLDHLNFQRASTDCSQSCAVNSDDHSAALTRYGSGGFNDKGQSEGFTLLFQSMGFGVHAVFDFHGPIINRMTPSWPNFVTTAPVSPGTMSMARRASEAPIRTLMASSA
jgi:hypothetical protein